ncbi:CDP-alcohol phosphatidyltransferase family protein [Amnibacterium setariae]|uniref:CDP-alcohol phosphatidyltransferase family protein n=1 Tax=Amnibacterium setariae TaxID=2306585 RepID=UPI001F2DAA76|nr:CDP-alcohol phosphatidyltransferase family protein [Amnibacterium setariae]
MTAASAASSAAGIALLITLPPSAVLGVSVAILLALGYVLDSADGQLARLTGSGSRAGEWLDHVVDAMRMPAIHLAVLVGLNHWLPEQTWAQAAALLFCIVAAGQFMSQVLAEQLSGRVHRAPAGRGGVLQSVVNLPTDTGLLCWLFLLWGAPLAFAVVYTALLVLNAGHALISMRRKHQHLERLGNAA